MKLKKKILIGCISLLAMGTLTGCHPFKGNSTAWYGKPKHARIVSKVKTDIVANLGKPGEIAFSNFRYDKPMNTEYVTLSKKSVKMIHQAQQPTFLDRVSSAKSYLNKNKKRISNSLSSDSSNRRRQAENTLKGPGEKILQANEIDITEPLLVWSLHEDRSKVSVQTGKTPRIVVTNFPSNSTRDNNIINSSGNSKKSIINKAYKKANDETGMALLRTIAKSDPLNQSETE